MIFAGAAAGAVVVYQPDKKEIFNAFLFFFFHDPDTIVIDIDIYGAYMENR